MKILVVDDEEVVCRSINKILSKEGYTVDEALSGETAIEKMGREVFLPFAFFALRKTPVPSQKICLKGAGRACTHQPGSAHRTLWMNASFGAAAVPEWNAKLPPVTLPLSSDPLWWLCSQSPYGIPALRPVAGGQSASIEQTSP